MNKVFKLPTIILLATQIAIWTILFITWLLYHDWNIMVFMVVITIIGFIRGYNTKIYEEDNK